MHSITGGRGGSNFFLGAAPKVTADYMYKSLTPFRMFLYIVDLSSFTGLSHIQKAENTLTVSFYIALNTLKEPGYGLGIAAPTLRL